MVDEVYLEELEEESKLLSEVIKEEVKDQIDNWTKNLIDVNPTENNE